MDVTKIIKVIRILLKFDRVIMHNVRYSSLRNWKT